LNVESGKKKTQSQRERGWVWGGGFLRPKDAGDLRRRKKNGKGHGSSRGTPKKKKGARSMVIVVKKTVQKLVNQRVLCKEMQTPRGGHGGGVVTTV